MLKKFVSYYKPYRIEFFFDMLASFLIAVIGMAYPVITRKVLNDYIPNNNQKYIVIFGLILLLCYLIRALLKFFVQYYGHVIGLKMQGDMRRQMFAKLQRLPFSYYDEHETGKIMSRMTNDLQEVSELAHHGAENFFICGASIIFTFVYLCTIDYRFALWVLACVPFLAITSIFFRKKFSTASRNTRKSVAEINASLESSITGIRVTKAFTNEEKEKEKFEVSNKKYIKERGIMFKAMGQYHSTTNFVTDLFNVVILVAGGLLVAPTKDITSYITFVVSVGVFITPLTTLFNFVEQFQDGKAGFERFIEVMNESEEEVDKDAISIPHLEGNITFDHVSFDYNESIKDETRGVLNDISLSIEKGKKVALVGPSGGGKTTICHLIPNFYHVSEGAISIDGHNINKLTFDSLRGNIGIVQQDVFLFNGTIKDNILYGRLDASDIEVYEAAKMANIHDYIMSLEHGYDTKIGERGIKLSGGQKQRISIARVFLKNPSILILDEATSALDNTTEIAIQNALDELTKGRTTIIVAHRLSTIQNADEIYVVEDGKIVEHGSHQNLLDLNQEYAKLYKAQFERKLF